MDKQQRDLAYWKGRKVQIREIVVEYVRAYRYASDKEAEQERIVLKARR